MYTGLEHEASTGIKIPIFFKTMLDETMDQEIDRFKIFLSFDC